MLKYAKINILDITVEHLDNTNEYIISKIYHKTPHYYPQPFNYLNYLS